MARRKGSVWNDSDSLVQGNTIVGPVRSEPRGRGGVVLEGKFALETTVFTRNRMSNADTVGSCRASSRTKEGELLGPLLPRVRRDHLAATERRRQRRRR
jgi:hypothetical protein